MIEIIKALQEFDHYGGGKYTEIAKGKHELNYSWRATKRKIKRLWLSNTIKR